MGVIRLSASRTKAKRKFDLPMSDFVRDLLIARRALGDAKYVFPGKSAHITNPSKAFIEIATKTGIEISPHDLRRTFCTVAESVEISPIALKLLINHSTGNDVTAGYVIMSSERLRAAAQRIAEEIKRSCGIADIAAKNVTRLKA
jgi:integrase